MDRDTVRDAIQNVKLTNSLIGPIEFDANGDLKNKIISVFQITKDDQVRSRTRPPSTSTSAWRRWAEQVRCSPRRWRERAG